MGEIVDSAGPHDAPATGEEPSAMERRIFRWMCATVLVAPLVGAALAPWRVATGLLLGGLLALFNHHWLRTSVAAVLEVTPAGARPRFRAARYVLRYLMIAAVVCVAYRWRLVSLGATLAGLCAFVPAALAEGFRQLYLAIVHREEA